MGKIYSNQTLLTLNFDTQIDLSDIATVVIKYRNSAGTVNQWNGVIASPATSGIVEYTDYDGLLTAGRYWFWLVMTDNSSKILVSEPDTAILSSEGF